MCQEGEGEWTAPPESPLTQFPGTSVHTVACLSPFHLHSLTTGLAFPGRCAQSWTDLSFCVVLRENLALSVGILTPSTWKETVRSVLFGE